MKKEKPSTKNNEKAYFTRHSKAKYETYIEALKSDDPQKAVEHEKQITPDLPERGVELAEQEAEEFLNNLDPEKDALFFVSSGEARALETANVYRRKARDRKFEIIKPEQTRSKLAEKIGKGEIRKLEALSINIDNVLLSSVFNPERQSGGINWKGVDKETRRKWDRAREIISRDDQGSWGANFFHHSEAIQKIFPEIKSAKDLYEKKFKSMIKLLRFGIKKIRESEHEKNIKILAFGHDSYLVHALNKYFEDHSIGNCETIELTIDKDDKITAKFRDQEKEI